MPRAKARAKGATAVRGADAGFLLAAAFVVALNLVPHGEIALYPLAVFTTWVHELSHAIAAIALGADMNGLLVRPDTSGLATYAFDPSSFGTISRAIVASAGYLGAALAGAGLLAAGRTPRLHRPVLASLGFLLVASTILWVRTAFGIVVLPAIAVALGVVALRRSPAAARWALWALGLQTSLNAVLDIRALYYVRAESDAVTMSRVVGLPAAFWATLWLAVGGFVVIRAALRAARA